MEDEWKVALNWSRAGTLSDLETSIEFHFGPVIFSTNNSSARGNVIERGPPWFSPQRNALEIIYRRHFYERTGIAIS